MIKLQHFEVDKIDPSINRSGKAKFHIVDMYICKKAIRAIHMVLLEEGLNDDWIQKKIRAYLKENGLQLCNLYMSEGMRINSIIVDENVKELIETL